ncbi:MAG TPA: DUF2267 domain-containing protein [Kofleriaceae bacterium]
MLLRIDQLASHVAAHAGVSNSLADFALRAVITGMGGYLSPRFRQLIADELPAALGSALESGATEQRPIEDRVRLAGMSPGQTRELIASVCRVLAEELSNEAVAALRSSLPAWIASLFAPSSPAIEHHASPIHRQNNSVAEPNPHGEIKISSGRRRTFNEPN